MAYLRLKGKIMVFKLPVKMYQHYVELSAVKTKSVWLVTGVSMHILMYVIYLKIY